MWESKIKSISIRKKAIEAASMGDFFSVHLEWKESRPSTMCIRQFFIWMNGRFTKDSVSLLLVFLLSDVMVDLISLRKEVESGHRYIQS